MVVVGIGARAGVAAADLCVAVDAALAAAGLTVSDVTVLATADRRAAEPAIREVALDRGWRLVALRAAELAGQDVPNPSRVVAAAVGTPSVAEAAALRAVGPAGSLILPKQKHAGITVAIARLGPRTRDWPVP
ncbi:cobalamin biosynthesis protein [Paractinoplanes hotanensis]|uniref:Cobalamin biosynthesis protein n=1 Tax=Paractinoplanes hotanensis TaxID=2906497 RepID=A0ABT0XV60_9ACTN|nr:cobalamin biosynthesis protein [Actinoplanes hotanensis]MCM4077671.1 cobalamin biosynthesis protein [Actinoplanes hotanensis]